MTEILSGAGLIFCKDGTAFSGGGEYFTAFGSYKVGVPNFGDASALNKSNLGLLQRNSSEDSDLWDCYVE